jgi:beta-barrel assembly-enhancing protease
MPARITRPDPSSDEGGLWGFMDREEARLRRSAFLIRDPALERYLTDLACRLAGHHCADLRVYATRSPFFNASMAPNGMMTIWSGLLLRVDNEAQLAAIIGHEIGHYVQRHALDRLRDARSRSAFAAIMIPFGLVGAIGQLAAIAGQFAFTREQEVEADRIGAELMTASGYDPRQAAQVWAQLLGEVKAGEEAGGDPAQRSVMFATHPEPAEREASLRERAEVLAAGRKLELHAEPLRKVIRPLRRMLLEDELRRRRPGESSHLIERLLATTGEEGELRYFLGEVFRLRAGKDDATRAIDAYGAAERAGDPPAEMFRGRGLVHWQLGNKAEASADFRRYLERAPHASDAAMIRTYVEPGTTKE